jgi:hypothetical protein
MAQKVLLPPLAAHAFPYLARISSTNAFRVQLSGILSEFRVAELGIPGNYAQYIPGDSAFLFVLLQVQQLVQLSGPEIISSPVGNKRQLLLYPAVSMFDKPKQQDREALEDFKHIIKTIVDACPKALYGEDRNERTAYQVLLQYSEDQKTSTDRVSAELRQALIVSLKEACIGDTFLHNMKAQFLYPPGLDGLGIAPF